jgi:uncharacterized membrane protein
MERSPLDLAIARIVHVLSVVMWIGGVGFVTTVLFPSIRRLTAPDERLAGFVRFENAFSWQARISVALVGLSGLYMTWRLDGWSRFAAIGFWWMDAMVAVWAIFALMLFVIEPAFLHRRLHEALASPGSGRLFDRMERLHWILLTLSMVAVLGAVGGSHGLWG